MFNNYKYCVSAYKQRIVVSKVTKLTGTNYLKDFKQLTYFDVEIISNYKEIKHLDYKYEYQNPIAKLKHLIDRLK